MSISKQLCRLYLSPLYLMACSLVAEIKNIIAITPKKTIRHWWTDGSFTLLGVFLDVLIPINIIYPHLFMRVYSSFRVYYMNYCGTYLFYSLFFGRMFEKRIAFSLSTSLLGDGVISCHHFLFNGNISYLGRSDLILQLLLMCICLGNDCSKTKL